jgi:hypothetical protein
MLKIPVKVLINDIVIKTRIRMQCERHRRYNPETDGRDGIRGACPKCEQMYEIYRQFAAARLRLEEAARDLKRCLESCQIGDAASMKDAKPQNSNSAIGVKPIATPSQLGEPVGRETAQ